MGRGGKSLGSEPFGSEITGVRVLNNIHATAEDSGIRMFDIYVQVV